jgi:hypothetical protein
MLGPRTKGSAALARAATLLQKKDDLSQLLASTLKLAPEHCKLSSVDSVVALYSLCQSMHDCKPVPASYSVS